MSANQITAAGIQTQTYDEIVEQLKNGDSTVPGFFTIYGSDINLDSNTPDGQEIGIFALSKKDLLNLATAIWQSKDPNQAVGVDLDACFAYCGISRKGGSYTTVYVTVTATAATTIYGTDQTSNDVFQVQDASGTTYSLLTTTTLSVGTTSLLFKCNSVGYVTADAGTLTTITTPTYGVSSVTNPSSAYSTGVDQESDALGRVRFFKSISMPSQNSVEGLRAALLNLPDVTGAKVWENTGTSTDSKGVPAKSLWVVCIGGTSSEIAETIYAYHGGGGLYGSTAYEITQSDGEVFEVAFDFATSTPLYIHITATTLSGATADATAIKSLLVRNLSFDIHDTADITQITTLLRANYSDLVVTACSVSADNSTFASTAVPNTYKKYFTVASGNITVTT